MPDSETPRASAATSNHYLWSGPLIAVSGLLSYFVFFARWPVFRDTGWLNFAILFAAIGISSFGLKRALSDGGWRVFAGVASTLFSIAIGALFCAYLFIISADIPSGEGVTAEGEAIPAVTLASYDGTQIDLAAADQGSTILVFYRGFW